MKLHHLSLLPQTPYPLASSLQERLVRRFLDSKASSSSIVQPPPPPTIITYTPPPTYTTGRRDTSLSPSQLSHLTTPTPLGTASLHHALRGGQTTYHGPGQLVAYPILDLRTHGLSPKCYVHLLESAVIATLFKYGVKGIRTEHPGVWTQRSRGEEKICAVGVHLRRFVSSHGVGLNVMQEPVEWLRRIVACGLEGKGASSLEGEGVGGLTVEKVGGVFVEVMAGMLEGVDGIIRVDEGDLEMDKGGEG